MALKEWKFRLTKVFGQCILMQPQWEYLAVILKRRAEMILDKMSLTGKTAIVTGASRGLGQAMAIGLAQAGADIAGVSRSGEMGETARLVESAGRRFAALSLAAPQIPA